MKIKSISPIRSRERYTCIKCFNPNIKFYQNNSQVINSNKSIFINRGKLLYMYFTTPPFPYKLTINSIKFNHYDLGMNTRVKVQLNKLYSVKFKITSIYNFSNSIKAFLGSIDIYNFKKVYKIQKLQIV